MGFRVDWPVNRSAWTDEGSDCLFTISFNELRASMISGLFSKWGLLPMAFSKILLA